MDRRLSSSFLRKKWLLFSQCLVVIISQIVLASLASKLIDKDIKELTILGCVFTTMFQLVGLLGAYKEHYGYTLTYAVYMNLGVLCSICTMVITPSFWWSAVLYLVACVMAWVFYNELGQIRLQLFSAPIYLTVPTGLNTATVPASPYIVAMSGPPTLPNGQQYNQQYCSQPAGTWQSPPPPYAIENQYCDEIEKY